MSSDLSFYNQVISVVTDFLLAKGSLKNLCYQKTITHKAATLALVQQTLKFRSVLMETLQMAQVPGFKRNDSFFMNRSEDEMNTNTFFEDGDAEEENDGSRILSKWKSGKVEVTLPENMNERKTDVVTSTQALSYSFDRECMLVLAYDLLFGEGLPRFFGGAGTKSGIPDPHGVAQASRLLTAKPTLPWDPSAALVEDERFERIAKNISHKHGKNENGNKMITNNKKSAPSTRTSVSQDELILKAKIRDSTTGQSVYVVQDDWSLKQRLKEALVTVCQRRNIVMKSPTRSGQEEASDDWKENLLPEALRHLYGRTTPRYLRVNTLAPLPTNATSNEGTPTIPIEAEAKHLQDKYSDREGMERMRVVLEQLVKEGYTLLCEPPEQFKMIAISRSSHPNNSPPTTPKASSGSDKQATAQLRLCWIDPYVPYLLGFMPDDQYIIRHKMVIMTRQLIIQDKASCLPPVALLLPHYRPRASTISPSPASSITPSSITKQSTSSLSLATQIASFIPTYPLADIDGDVIDGCSAPGNKTSFLAALMRNSNQIYAIEKNTRRAKLLSRRLEEAHVRNTTVLNQSFLDLDPKDPKFKNVKAILLDPSCSGSGNPSLDTLLANDGKMHTHTSLHVRSLSDLQTSLVRHAFNFPAVERIVYSTCSIYERENEGVVTRLWQSISKDGLAFVVAPALPTWPVRGYETFPIECLGGVDFVSTPTNQLSNSNSASPLHSFINHPIAVTKKGLVNFSFAAKCVRSDPNLCHTGGFFVSAFRRSTSQLKPVPSSSILEETKVATKPLPADDTTISISSPSLSLKRQRSTIDEDSADAKSMKPDRSDETLQRNKKRKTSSEG